MCLYQLFLRKLSKMFWIMFATTWITVFWTSGEWNLAFCGPDSRCSFNSGQLIYQSKKAAVVDSIFAWNKLAWPEPNILGSTIADAT